ncbi:MAG: transglutaminase family protein, partial [Miltoncostaeaceae bacterium]
MLKLRVSHRTEIRYPSPVVESVNHVRLTPRTNDRQLVRATSLSTFPEATVTTYRDSFENEVAWFQLHQPHDRLVIESRATVEPAPPLRPNTEALTRASWELLAEPEYRDEQAEFLAPSTLVGWGGAIDAFDRELSIEAASPGEWLVAAELAVAGAIVYAPGFTRSDTPIERVLQIRRGVCQDLSQTFIALARRRGIATRYVSGWLWEPDTTGPTESHAWAEAFLPRAGWVQFDPTHPDPDLTRYVRIGVGRDYADVPPVRG